MSIKSIRIISAPAVTTFGTYYPRPGDELSMDIANESPKIMLTEGFEKLQQLNNKKTTKVAPGIYMTGWIKVGENLYVQVVINFSPKSLIFIWKVNGNVETSGISTGN
jgi:hypothetical protein